MASTDARPIPIKNTAFRAVFPILDADGDLVTGATGLDSEVSKDQGTFADCTNEATEIATASGMYYLDLTSTEMNADCVAVIVKTTSSGAKTTVLVFYPEEAGDINVDVTAWNGTAIPGVDTAGYPKVTIKDGTGTGEIDTTSGGVLVAAIAANAITATAINADAITAAKIADGAIDAATFAAGAINAAAIADGAIDRATFAADTGLQTIRSNTAQAGAAGSITLDASASATTDFYKGCWIFLTGGTGVGQVRLCTAYNGTSKVATIAPNWATNPDATSTFAVLPAAGVDLELIAAAAVSTSTAQLGVNVVNFGGAAGTFASGRPETNTTHIAGSAVSTSSAQIGVNVVNAGATAWNSGAIKTTTFTAGAIDAAAIAADAIGASELAADAASEIGTAVWATAARTLTAATNITSTGGTTVPQTGDSYARLGAPAGASVSADVAAVKTDTGNILTKLLKYVQLLVRKDAAIATDNATELTAINANGGSGAGAYDQTTDSLEANRDNIGTAGAGLTAADDATITAIGALNNLSQANIRTAVGLAAANLDTQLTAIDDYIDTEVAAIKAKTDLIPASPAATSDIPSAATIADAVWDEALSGHTTAGSAGKALGDIDTHTDTETGAAAIRAAVGLASANLDTQLDALPTAAEVRAEVDSNSTQLAAIVADTNEVQAELADGGRTDLLIDAIKAKTDNIPASPAAVSDIPTATENADALLKRDWTSVTGEAARSVLNALRALRNRVAISSGTVTVYEEDDTTSAWTAAATTDASADPITEVDPS